MEEQNKNSKEIKMNPSANGKQTELTNEQLKDMANKLFNENRWLKQQLQQAQEYANTINRLDYLFRVVDIAHNNRNNSVSFASEFVEKCIDEIQNALTLPESAKETEGTKEN